MKTIISLAVLTLLTSCAIGPSPIPENPNWIAEAPFGQDKAALDSYFNQLGGTTTSTSTGLSFNDNGAIEGVYVYKWMPSRLAYSRYKAVFIDGLLSSFSLIDHDQAKVVLFPGNNQNNKPQRQGMSFMCKDAITRNDQGGIMVHCK